VKAPSSAPVVDAAVLISAGGATCVDADHGGPRRRLELGLKRNNSTRDAHVLALACSVEADIWTADRDFAGTGVATWSTPNLMRRLAEAADDRKIDP
jgi:predicted nucleic acid-binding protein